MLKATPTDLPGVFRKASEILQTNGLHKGDFIPDPFNRRGTTTPDAERPMSLDSAIRCAVTGDPRMPSPLADEALRFTASRLTVHGKVCTSDDDVRILWHLLDWSSRQDTTTDRAVLLLDQLAEQADQHLAQTGVAA